MPAPDPLVAGGIAQRLAPALLEGPQKDALELTATLAGVYAPRVMDSRLPTTIDLARASS